MEEFLFILSVFSAPQFIYSSPLRGAPLIMRSTKSCIQLLMRSTEFSISNSQSSSVYRGGAACGGGVLFFACFRLLLTPSGRALRDSFGELKLILSKFGCTQHSANKFASAFVCTNFPVVASSAVASHCPLLMRSTGFQFQNLSPFID